MSAFLEAVEYYLKDCYAISPGTVRDCGECNVPDDASDEDLQAYDEPSFSRVACDSCGSTYGGDRFHAHCFTEINGKERMIHLDICVDCIMYHANGEEPEEWRQHP